MEHRDAAAGREPHGQRLGGHRSGTPATSTTRSSRARTTPRRWTTTPTRGFASSPSGESSRPSPGRRGKARLSRRHEDGNARSPGGLAKGSLHRLHSAMPSLPRRSRVVLAMVAFVAGPRRVAGRGAGRHRHPRRHDRRGHQHRGAAGERAQDRGHGDRHRRDTWRGTGYTLTTGTPGALPDQCVNTDDRETNGKVGNLTAPGASASTTPLLGIGERRQLRHGRRRVATAKALTVQTPAPNPNLPPRCGIDVMLVLDESGSINTSGRPRW